MPFGLLEALAVFHKSLYLSTARRAPKVTVTREGDTLCQKGCYPVGSSLLLIVFCFLILLQLSSLPPANLCLSW
jgi:hypothetical protein